MTEKEAFILGAAHFCKCAGITGDDRDAFVQLVANGDAETIAKVAKTVPSAWLKLNEERSAKGMEPISLEKWQAEQEKRPTDAGATDAGAAEAAAAETAAPAKPAAKPKPKKPNAAYIRELMGGLSSGDLADAPVETYAELQRVLPHLSGEQFSKAINAISQAGAGRESWQATPEYGEGWGNQFRGAIGYDDPLLMAAGKGTTPEYGQLLSSAMEQAKARLLKDPNDQYAQAQYQALAEKQYGSLGGDYTSPEAAREAASRDAQRMAQEVRSQRLKQQEEAAAEKERLASDPSAATAAAAEPAAAAAPAYTPTELTDADREAANKSLGVVKMFDKMPQGGKARTDMLGHLSNVAKLATEDPKLAPQLVKIIRSSSLTPEEQQQYAPMTAALSYAAGQYGKETNDWSSLAGLKADTLMSGRLAESGLLDDPTVRAFDAARRAGDRETAARIKAENPDNDMIGQYEKMREEIETPLEEQMTSAKMQIAQTGKETGGGTKDVPWQQQNLETLRKMWREAKEDPMKHPHLQRRIQQGQTADQFFMGRQGAATSRANRLEMRQLQYEMGTNMTWPEVASMTAEEMERRAGGDATLVAQYQRMKGLARALGSEGLPAAAGQPEGEGAVSKGVDPKEAVPPEKQQAAEQAAAQLAAEDADSPEATARRADEYLKRKTTPVDARAEAAKAPSRPGMQLRPPAKQKPRAPEQAVEELTAEQRAANRRAGMAEGARAAKQVGGTVRRGPDGSLSYVDSKGRTITGSAEGGTPDVKGWRPVAEATPQELAARGLGQPENPVTEEEIKAREADVAKRMADEPSQGDQYAALMAGEQSAGDKMRLDQAARRAARGKIAPEAKIETPEAQQERLARERRGAEVDANTRKYEQEKRQREAGTYAGASSGLRAQLDEARARSAKINEEKRKKLEAARADIASRRPPAGVGNTERNLPPEIPNKGEAQEPFVTTGPAPTVTGNKVDEALAASSIGMADRRLRETGGAGALAVGAPVSNPAAASAAAAGTPAPAPAPAPTALTRLPSTTTARGGISTKIPGRGTSIGGEG